MVAKIVKSKTSRRTLNTANIRFALLVLADLIWILLAATSRAVDCARQPTPRGSPACLQASRIELAVLAGGGRGGSGGFCKAQFGGGAFYRRYQRPKAGIWIVVYPTKNSEKVLRIGSPRPSQDGKGVR
jgi:hypothetical protein